MASKYGYIGLAMATFALFGCTAETLDESSLDADDESVDEARLAFMFQNGLEINGTITNGTYCNGIKENGIKENGIKENGIKENGTGLQATDDTGATITGTGLAGTYLTAVLGTGSETTIYIAEVRTGEISGKFTYVFKQDNALGENICSTGESAVAINGRWDYATGGFIDDPTQFTVACRGASLAKCVELGYWPDSTLIDGVERRLYHQACTRMIRDDLCGNGVAHTANGTLIDIWDKGNIQARTADATLKFEAEWGPNGATCYRHSRKVTGASGVVTDYTTSNSTACGDNIVDQSCGDTWRTGGLVRNASGINDYSQGTFDGWSW